MKFENVIKKLSSTVAAIVVFLLAAQFYLSAKGFTMNEAGEIVLVRPAHAAGESAVTHKEIPVNLAMPESHSLGSADAPVTLYEYSSFGCSHCADFHLKTLPQLKEKYIDKGQVRLVFVPFPIDRASMNGALLAECVSPERYFAFVEVLFKKQREWGLSRDPDKVLKQYAALSGVGGEAADKCLRDDKTAQEILEARQNGVTQLGIQGTPSFVVSGKDGRQLLSGAQSLEKFEEIIQQKLAQ